MMRDLLPFRPALAVVLAFSLGACASTGEPTVPDSTPDVAVEAPPETAETEVIEESVEAAEESAPFPEMTSAPQSGSPLAEDAEGIWPRVREHYQLPDYLDEPRVQSHIDWYRCHPDFLERVTARAEPFLHLINEKIEARGLPSELLLLPVVESAYLPYAYSHGRAAGLWQFIPSTGKHYGLKQNWWYDGRRDITASTDAALDYLEFLNEQFDGDWLLALAAYNTGQGNVRRAMRQNERRGRPTDFWHLDLPRETEHYVPRLLATAAIVADPDLFSMPIWTVPDEPYLTQVDTGSQIDLAVAARLADMDMEEIYLLNPGFNRWATDPDGPHHLLLPLDKADLFEKNLTELPTQQRVTWLRHKIRSGETLSEIAEQYGTTTRMLKRSNNLNGHIIRAGDHLLVPTAGRASSEYTLTADLRRESTQNAPRNGQKRIHIVQRGDSLWAIARQYGVSVKQVASWNAMAPGDTLRPGQQLVLWLPTKQVEAALSGPNFSHPLLEETQRKVRYSVRSGDSLFRIAQRFGVGVTDIQRWNGMGDRNLLRPGQSLTLYVDVTRQGS